MIGLEKDGDLWIVTLNRPDKANSLTPDMLEHLCDIAESAGEARALILTGAGKVFSAGADLDAARAGLATSPLWERLSTAIAALPGLTIAALNGTLAGGSNGMALACDLRIAVPGAKVFYPVMKLGYLPQPSDPGRLAALVGPARAKLILMGGQKITTDEAYAFGLIDRIVAPDDLLPTARALAADTLAAKPEIARGIKDMCRAV
ncbi:Enoyl-CoA hydratase/carnithine racemase [Lutimaribacter pacificus]|uniref:Enoyl-CoA hydratase/carnithine racemase n=1 Tax=Lutimaribacter pacificus TaxID=391948 RepID=A0A1H0GEL6_9RHOB|nr:enoyl-CoA hydratase/isomerase family protein [Lutimaribacter pacificus]SDO05298.1 Enoyl-CoA hydratase/carnithine racemase [Lutimaribacter pacificus]SHJ87504.1 Enoyl-CoA hydratase/carnithine racemase [Lutimaribacter pacificus]